MSIRLVMALALLGMALVAGCNQNKPSMAVINSKDILTKCNDGLRVSQDIQHEFNDRQSDLKKQEEAILKLQNDPGLADAKSGKKDELQRLTKQYLDAGQQLRKDVANAESTKFKPVVDKINKALGEYAKANGITSIQDRSGFAYVDQSIDITEAIIKLVDQMK